MSKRTFGLVLSFGISGALLFYVLSDLNWGMFLSEVKRLKLAYLPLLLLLYVIPFGLRAWRQSLLLPETPPASFNGLVDGLVLGTLASCVLPLRAGEFVRPWLLQRSDGVKFSTGLASVVTERVFDVLALMVLLVLALSRLENVPPFVALGAKSLGLLTVAIVVVMAIAYVKPQLFSAFCQSILQRMVGARSPALVNKVSAMLDEFTEGLRGMKSWSELLLVVLSSLLIWALYALTYQVGLWAFGDTPSLWVGTTVCVMVSLAIAAPSAPGFVGTYQAGCLAALTGLFGYPQEFSVAYSVVLHVLNLLTVLVVGFLSLHRQGLVFRDLSAASAQASTQ